MKKFWLLLIGGILLIIGPLAAIPPESKVGPIIGLPLLAVGIALIVMAVKSIKTAKSAKKQPKQPPQAQSKPSSSRRSAPQVVTDFDRAVDALPLVQIEPNPNTAQRKQYLKALPELPYKSITSRTKVENLFPLVVIDCETTGLNVSNNKITEVAAIRYENDFTPTIAFATLVNPGKPIPDEASAINGITDEMVEDAPTFTSIREQLQDFIEGCNIMGHNLEFDIKFLYAAGLYFDTNVKYYDMLPLAQKVLERGTVVTNHKLDTLCRYYKIKRGSAHRALSDCYAEALVFEHLVEERTIR